MSCYCGFTMMLSSRFLPHLCKRSASKRFFSSQVQKRADPVLESSDSPQERIAVTPTKKRILVWSGVFNSSKDVPEFVSLKTMTKSMDRFRVRMLFVLMAICGLGALSSVFLAKDTVETIEETRSTQK